MAHRLLLVALFASLATLAAAQETTPQQLADCAGQRVCVALPLVQAAAPALVPTPTAIPTTAPTATRIPATAVPPTATRVPPTAVPPTPTRNPAACDPAYPTVCIPPPPPDLDCGDIPHRRFTVLAPDPHRFDQDGNGIGCESG